MSFIALPPTPQKALSSNHGISTQILPLHRLSLSSNSTGNSPPNPCDQRDAKNQEKSVAKENSNPVKEKIQKIGKTLTEPLFQYFHDLQVSVDCEEPEVLNTPKSLSVESSESGGFRSRESLTLPRKLFATDHENDKSEPKKYENVPPITITDM